MRPNDHGGFGERDSPTDSMMSRQSP